MDAAVGVGGVGPALVGEELPDERSALVDGCTDDEGSLCHGWIIGPSRSCAPALSLSHQEDPGTGRDRRDGAGGRTRGGAGGAPGVARGGIVSESVAKALRGGIGGEKKRGISTFLLRRPGLIRNRFCFDKAGLVASLEQTGLDDLLAAQAIIFIDLSLVIAVPIVSFISLK